MHVDMELKNPVPAVQGAEGEEARCSAKNSVYCGRLAAAGRRTGSDLVVGRSSQYHSNQSDIKFIGGCQGYCLT